MLVDMAIVAAEPVPASNRFDETTEQLVLKIDAGASGLVKWLSRWKVSRLR